MGGEYLRGAALGVDDPGIEFRLIAEIGGVCLERDEGLTATLTLLGATGDIDLRVASDFLRISSDALRASRDSVLGVGETGLATTVFFFLFFVAAVEEA